MLPFFRKMRYRLAESNQPASPAGRPACRTGRFLKYSRYAIGEILLVIIGILVALYVNERTIDRVNTISTLDSLLQGEAPVYNKSLDTLFGAVWGVHSYPIDNKATYENLKSRGLNTVQVDSIKQQLIYLYEEIYPGLESLYDIEIHQNDNVYLPYYIKNFSNVNFTVSATPLDFKSVWKDNVYHNIVSYRLTTLKTNQVPTGESSIKEMQKLCRMIENYLDIVN